MAFGKKNEESIGLLQAIQKDENNTKTSTKYGTIRKTKDKNLSISDLFRYASKIDVVLMCVGIICSVIHGSSFPVLALVFGQMTNTFITQTVPFNQSSMKVNLIDKITKSTTQNYSLVNIPLSDVENNTDLINFNPFTSSYDHINRFDTSESSDVKDISSLDDESSTLREFFMSGMEQLTTTKTITTVELEKTINHKKNSKSSRNEILSPEEFYDYVTKFSMYYLYIGCGVLVTTFIQTYCWEISSERQVNRIRRVFFRQILRQEISWFDLSDGEDMTIKLSDDLERIREGIGSKFSIVTQYASTFFTGIIIGLCVNWRLTLIIFCIAPFLIVVSGALSMISASTVARERTKYALAGSIAEEVLSNIRTIAAFGGELRECKRYELAIEEGRKLTMKKYCVFAILLGSVFLIMYSAYGIAFWYGSNLISEGISSPGSIFTVFFSVMAGAFSVGNVLPFIGTVNSAIDAASNIFGIIDSVPYIDPYSSKGEKINKFKGKVEFKNVSFTYPTRNTLSVLNNMTLQIQPDQTIAIVNSTGGGKSTIGNLLLRFYDPTEGQIFLDDTDLKHLNIHWLRSNIGIISQEPVLFSVSVAENIRYGQSKCTKQDIIDAAMTANAHEFIIKLPKGYDTLVGDMGFHLSIDQKQRIAIARVLVKDPKLLFIDEATSKLETRNEGIVQDALEKVQKNRTTIIIAHKLSTIKNVDVIYVLQNGNVVESGNHDLLMTMNGQYSNLVNAQMKQEYCEESSLQSDDDIKDYELNDLPLSSIFDESNTLFSTNQISLKNSELESNEVDSNETDDNIKVQSIIEKDYTKITTNESAKEKYIGFKKLEPENVEMKDLIKFNCPEWPWLIMGFTGCALTGTIMPAFAIFYGQVFATFTLKGDTLLQEAAFWSKMFILLAILSGLAWWMQTIGLTNACEKLIMRLRVKAFENILRQPVFWFDFKSSSPSNLTTRLAKDAPIVKSAAGLRAGQVISIFVTLLAALIIAFTFGWKLAIVLVLGVPLIAGASYKQLMLVRKNQKQDFQSMDKADRIASESVASIKTVQGLAQELIFIEQYENSLKDPFKASKRQAVSYAVMYAITQAVIYGMYSFAFRYGAYLVEIGDMSAKDIYRVFFALTFCAASVGQSSAYLQDYARAKHAAMLIFQLIWRKSEIDPTSISGLKPEIKGKVHFKDVSFKYPSRPNIQVLRGLNFTLEPGQILAIVGQTGCGKSTVLSLLERFYDPSRGVIEVDDHDIRAINLRHLRKHIGIVTQEPILFNCSIKDNITYGLDERNIMMDEIIDVAQKANIHNFITSLSQRYDTLVGDQGNQLSDGQKQRIAIARALLRNPKILLLDEPTSALDPESESIVHKTLDASRKGHTCIIIAHHLSTIQLADFIAVVRGGKIVEYGNHEKLIAKKKYYYELIKHQKNKSN